MGNSWFCGSCGMRNLTSNSCSDCGAIQRNSRASELSLLIGREGSSTPTAPTVRAIETYSQPVIAQTTVSDSETRNYRPLIIFGNMVVALAVILILGIVSFFIGILATAL